MRDILKYTRSEATAMTFDDERRLIPVTEEETDEETE
jgi:hypothetical protein